METVVLYIFISLLFLVFVYSLSELNLLLNFFKGRKLKNTSEKLDFTNGEEISFVTIQLPVYNEKNVVERLLKNISRIEYPREKLEIQVLDDSTDDSVLLTAQLISTLQNDGLDIKHIRRTNRKGFKAGALKEGLEIAKGEFIAIFDSDFLPGENWLLETVPYFKDKNIGVVQTRWGHLNRDFSLLTKIQAFALDFHFILEQTGRNFGNHFINFNGTAGIWRKQCILEAGNWSGDTLTEDLDLSYRAQLENWKFKYLEKVETPAELPITLPAARSQQFRWNKGAAENFQKNFSTLFRNKNVTLGTKFHAFFHLLNSSLFLLVLALAISSVPVLFILDSGNYSGYAQIMAFFGISTLIFFFCYWITFSHIHGKNWHSFLRYIGMFFAFFSIAMGLSVHNSIAALEGHFGKKSEFIRTPKFNISEKGKNLKFSSTPVEISFQLLLEILLFLYFIVAAISAFVLNNFSMIVFHMMLVFGFGYVVFQSLNIRGSISYRKEKPNLTDL
ncbi:glycosyl transferase [Salinimicrobium marinum]|uniref:Glycosyl transferase n=1 Tax=Salinimicrobium marinum TaxID=680283 RepID=A0A918VZY9_9FLAO|nr:cellulose synthase family protein [Salinimicrobium marinum]GHA42958.1 glycosyl transferase [Salinimicrobium marinum]